MTIKELQEETYRIILSLGKFLNNGYCELCLTQAKSGKGHVIHHRKYRKNELTHKDFIKSGRKQMTPKERLAYYRYLEPIVRKNPKRFRFIHNKDHSVITKLLRYKKDKRLRLFDLVNESE